MLYNYIYCYNPEADVPVMLINKHIGMDADDGMGIDDERFVIELLELDKLGKESIEIWINSVGGNVLAGMNIYHAALKTKTKVNTRNVGVAASIAAVIFQAGRTRTMSDYAKLMYHNPYGADPATLEPIRDSIAIMIAERVGKSKEDILSIMRKTTWLDAEEALADGFCDKVQASGELNKRREIKQAEDVTNLWKDCNKILNSFINKPTKPNSMKLICNKLGLNSEANEAAVMEAITNIENKHKAEKEGLEAQKKTLEDSITAKEKELKAIKDQLATLTAEKEAAENAAKAAKEAKDAAEIQNTLKAYAKDGRISEESIKDWTETAKVIGIEKLKNQLEALPRNKVEKKKIEVGEGGAGDEKLLTGVIAKSMAEVRNKLGL